MGAFDEGLQGFVKASRPLFGAFFLSSRKHPDNFALGCTFRGGHRLGVEIERDIAVRMANQFLDTLDVFAIFNQQRCNRATECVPADCVFNSGCLGCWTKMPTNQHPRPIGPLPAVLWAGKDPIFASVKRGTRSPLPKQICQKWIQRDRLSRCLALALTDHPIDNAAPNVNLLFLKVNVLPPQT